MNVSVYNVQGKKEKDMALNDAIFGVPTKTALVHQVYHAIEANAREPWAHTKTKDEVRGGGKKPWKQKGTGRARHGSTRSPIWKGGGVTFGPRNVRNYTQRINKKMKQLATKMVLSSKAKNEKFFIVEGLTDLKKTKDMSTLVKTLPLNGKSTLIIGGEGEDFGLIVRNIPQVHLQRAIDMNVVDILHHQYIVATQKAIETLESRLA
ncbi:MAG: 50S ribosomal protein L4 [Candidatus Magasanikbacteria bacterium GW2011_GWD2_43_18]|uniref:Large ribosomal subunit protein uL4 n=1 Tax=Candidatus Magasanikbacteria bacterium GW2011_GWE2_42_7 TaxID=1619052 RepID=A0A0G1BFH9_9BACT|nr:MAG: 50S ribosomal protein L4 [Candidatus Magasanikbacteria bacterium GW2011_GWC2_42_27]KKS71954.1 MAG: 50S ribosomal protein L4 [Candidatus Magasanikbacteria bacterium GW2011_GWE2_42_7]KKT04302.1 MAG: 50S ribosomal protein L4 [Candidatus Magasanikbacteria bacterium GW2011_GWD2_43_18]KKT24877.1 MAG: 50S ribosomal protein L4 [Candidatus Magasanikbacteria bacterium GW2011_GWA2_43_9]